MAEHHRQLHAAGLQIERGGRLLLTEMTLTLAPGDRVGLLGPNGSGKSSLLAVLAGRLPPTAGSIRTVPEQATVGLLDQELEVDQDETVAAYLARRTGVTEASLALDEATACLAEGTEAAFERHHLALERWMALGADDLEGRIGPTLAEVGLTTERVLDQPTATLSGGEQAKVGLAALLLARHDILLLDEPTNNLDQRGLQLLEAHVLGRQGPVMVVSHDRHFLGAVANAVVEIDPYTARASRYEETFTHYLEAREVAARHARNRYENYVGERDRLQDRARTQRQWAEKGVRGERTPPDNDRAARGARIERTEKQAAKARQTERALDRLDVVDKPWEPWELRFTIGTADRAGNLVAALDDAVIEHHGFTLGPVSLTVGAGERVAVVGANGAGKTTLVRALFGLAPLDAGRSTVGPGVRVGWLGQDRTAVDIDRPDGAISAPAATRAGPPAPSFDNATTALDHTVTTTGLVPGEARSLLAKFGLGPEDVTRPLADLSPGERTRLVLATFQAAAINTLVLDEPTNHLDLEAISQLEQALTRYQGTLVLVSHDRAFLDATTLTRRLTVAEGRLLADEVV